MSAGRTEGSCLNGCPLGIMLGVRSCKGACDSSHAVAGPAEESLRARLTSVDWGEGECLEANGGMLSLKPAVSVNKQQCARNAVEACRPPT